MTDTDYLPHVWKPKEGLKPARQAIGYYCERCHRTGTERDIARKISKRCFGVPQYPPNAEGVLT